MFYLSNVYTVCKIKFFSINFVFWNFTRIFDMHGGHLNTYKITIETIETTIKSKNSVCVTISQFHELLFSFIFILPQLFKSVLFVEKRKIQTNSVHRSSIYQEKL
ncbi:hypothetical protein HanRHA438_Chr04g0183611 [Helianthus annuus]|nr:hypothetical protein HanRHA438_Chr04g0183611 [Helianthus annuus]